MVTLPETNSKKLWNMVVRRLLFIWSAYFQGSGRVKIFTFYIHEEYIVINQLVQVIFLGGQTPATTRLVWHNLYPLWNFVLIPLLQHLTTGVICRVDWDLHSLKLRIRNLLGFIPSLWRTWAVMKTLLTFHYTGWLIGILVLAYYNPHIVG